MNSEDVKRLRKAGQLQEALDTVRRILDSNPRDLKAKSEYEWVIFECIKILVRNLEDVSESRAINPHDTDELIGWMEDYYRLDPHIPGMACSNILGQLAKVGRHIPDFPELIRRVGAKNLRDEDWQPRQYQGKTYPSLAMSIARTLCKWIKTHPEANQKQMAFALDWAERVSRATKDDDSLWIHWDMAILLRQMGDFRRAAEYLASVIKTKRNEFWVWAEAGRLYRAEQPELALACFCRALECPSEPKFLVRAHLEFAELLAEQEEYAQASREVAMAADIRQAEGWPIGRELEALISSPWYDAVAARSENPRDFYGKHSPSALSLCFDIVETREANYLGLLIPHTPKDPRPDWKPKPLSRFAIKDRNGHTWSLVSPASKKLQLGVGAPLTLIIGRHNGDDRQTVLHVSPREEGQQWDALGIGVGVVTREASAEKSAMVLIVDSGEDAKIDGAPAKSLRIGDGVRCYFARNPKNNRLEIATVERQELPETGVRQISAQLRRAPKGFGFVDDAFVPPDIAASIDPSIEEVVAIAVHAKNRKKDAYGWRVIELKPAECAS